MTSTTMEAQPRRTLLVVEDDEAIRETLAELLHDEGFAVATAENGAVALSYLRSHEPPALILLDLMMPVMDGVEFRKKQLAEAALAGIPALVMSAAHMALFTARRMNATAFLAKPFDVDHLMATVHRLC